MSSPGPDNMDIDMGSVAGDSGDNSPFSSPAPSRQLSESRPPSESRQSPESRLPSESRQLFESRQPSESRPQSASSSQAYPDVNTANGSSFGDGFDDTRAIASIDEFAGRFSNVGTRSEGLPPLGLDGAGDIPHPFGTEQAKKDKRIAGQVERFWNIHNVHNVVEDYDDEEKDLEGTWKKAMGGLDRPKAYTKESVPKGGFLPLTNSDTLVNMLKNPESMSTDELYALTANVDNVMRAWQAESAAIDDILHRAIRDPWRENQKPKRKNPQAPEDPIVFEDKKEAMLYGYTHKPSEPGNQKPFLQGPLKPTSA